jgi:hypothetical protein
MDPTVKGGACMDLDELLLEAEPRALDIGNFVAGLAVV